MTAPAVLSVFDNTDATLKFCHQLRMAGGQRRMRVVVDLEGVTRFSSDALMLMRAIMHAHGFRTTFSGNLPSIPDVAAKLKASGFFNGFDRPPGELPTAKGLMLSRSSRRVHSEIAADLVRFAMRNAVVTREQARVASNTLIEAMTNTHNHSSGGRGQFNRGRRGKHLWYAGVYCEERAAAFTFVDLGVGILRGQNLKAYVRFRRLRLPAPDRSRLLGDVFQGIVGSSTGEPGRGNGLPRMRRDAVANLLPGLSVATSQVVGVVATDQFTTAEMPMVGTLFRWTCGDARG